MNYSSAIAKFKKFQNRYDTNDSFADFLDFEIENADMIESLLAEHSIEILIQEKRENAILANVDSLTDSLESFLTESIYKDLIISDSEKIEISKNDNIDNMIANVIDYAISNLSLVARLESKQSQILQISDDLLKVYTTKTNIRVKCSTINSKLTFNTRFLRDLLFSDFEIENAQMIETKKNDSKHFLKKMLQLNILDSQAVQMIDDNKIDHSACTFANISKIENLAHFLELVCYSLNKHNYTLAKRNTFQQVMIIDSITYKL